MFNIIKEGDPSKIILYKLTCKNCGCEFEASDDEFQYMIPPQPAPAIAMANGMTGPNDSTQVISTTFCPYCHATVSEKLTYGEVSKRNVKG